MSKKEGKEDSTKGAKKKRARKRKTEVRAEEETKGRRK